RIISSRPNRSAAWRCSCARKPPRRSAARRCRSTAAGRRNSSTDCGRIHDMKTVSLEKSVAMIPDGASLMIGGFMAVGTPERVVDEIVRQNKRDLTVIANDTATPDKGIGKLVTAKSLRKAIVSHIGLNPDTQRQMMAGELEVQLVPQGTLIERIRAGGFGLGGILTQTGLGTPVQDEKQVVKVDGK